MDVKKVLEKYGIVPDPAGDQHFMHDRKYIRLLVRSAGIRKGETVLEIGSGIGSLTEALLETGASITAVEIDSSLRKAVDGELGKNKNLEMVWGDALEYLKKNRAFGRIVSNTPYSICEPLLQILAKTGFKKAVLSVPMGFYRTITARPGQSEYSKLSMLSQCSFRTSLLFPVPKEAFHPIPGTETLAISLVRLGKTHYIKSPADFLAREILLRPGMRTKNAIREALISYNSEILGKPMTKNQAREIIRKMRLTGPGKRVNETNVQELVRIRQALAP